MSTYTPYNPFTSTYPKLYPAQLIETLSSLQSCLILDTEAIGKIGKEGQCIEVSVVHYPSREVFLNTLIQPIEIEDNYENSTAYKIHGISREELERAPTFKEVWTDLLPLLVNKFGPIAAFNADYDMRSIRNTAMKNGINPPPLKATCLMKLYDSLRELDFYASLDEATQYYNIDTSKYTERHRALADTLITCDVLQAMLEEIK